MKKLQETIESNPFIANTHDTIFTVLLKKVFANNPELSKRKPYIHGLLQYPKWHPTSDIFKYIKPKYFQYLLENNCYFVFDASTEGFSTLYDQPFFDMLYYNCEKYNIDPCNIIYVSSNLRDEDNIKIYCEKNYKKPINVFSFLSFEQVLAIDENKSIETCDELFQKAEINCSNSFNEYYFSSLSRLNRPWRMYAQASLVNSDVSHKALCSHDKVAKNDLHFLTAKGLSSKQIKRFTKKLPLTIDHTNFQRNWAVQTDFRSIHDQTIFQIVNETLVEDHNSSTLFYSEKTFRPISMFQPFIIWGQKGANKHLQNIGYHLYDEWFDLSFDDESNHKKRYQMLLQEVKRICNKLDSLSRDKKIEWRFKNRQLLEHNFKVMAKSEYSYNKLCKFVEDI